MSNKSSYFIAKNVRNNGIEEIVDEAITGIQQLNMQDGNALIPSYSFVNSPSTGIYLGSGHHINFSSLGVQRFHVADDHIRCYEPLRLSATDFPALCFQGDTDSGLRWNSDGDMALMSNNLNALRVWPVGVAVLERPFYVNTVIAGNEPFMMLEGVQSVSLLSASTVITQKASVSDRSLQFRNVSSSLPSTDIAYKWQNNTATSEHQLSNRMQHLGVSGSGSVPTYAFQASPNAGVYYLNGIAFSHGSTQRMLISNSGVRIGANGLDIPTLRHRIDSVSGATVTISFGYTYSSPPNVVFTCYLNNSSYVWIYTLQTVTTTNFTYKMYLGTIANPALIGTAGDAHSCNWIAIGT